MGTRATDLETMSTMGNRPDPSGLRAFTARQLSILNSFELRPLREWGHSVFLEDGTQLTLSRYYRSGLRDRLAPEIGSTGESGLVADEPSSRPLLADRARL